VSLTFSCCKQVPFSVSLHGGKRGLQQGMESRKEKRQEAVCVEGNGEGADSGKTEREFGYE